MFSGKTIWPFASDQSTVPPLSPPKTKEKMKDDIDPNLIYEKLLSTGLLNPNSSTDPTKTGVAILNPSFHYIFAPATLSPKIIAAASTISATPGITVTIASDITSAVIRRLQPGQKTVRIERRNEEIRVVENLDAMFFEQPTKEDTWVLVVREENFVLLWADGVRRLRFWADRVEKMLLESLWGSDLWGPDIAPPIVQPIASQTKSITAG